jgi:hypothetical protein
MPCLYQRHAAAPAHRYNTGRCRDTDGLLIAKRPAQRTRAPDAMVCEAFLVLARGGWHAEMPV